VEASVITFIVAFFGFYLFHSLGITLGYHRLLSHRSLRVPKWLEYLIVSGGYLALEGSPIFGITTHRLHHRYSDHPGDPHSPMDGLWHAFIAWMWNPKVIVTPEESRKISPDLYRDPVYRFLHCRHTHWDGILCLAAAIVFRIAIFALFGPIVLAANLFATLMAFVGPLLVNSFSHLERFGYQSYDCNDGSRNVWFVALLSLGEGWHNNHHAFPQSARHGLKVAEPDATWMTICVLKLVGLASDIRLPKTPSRVAFPPIKIEPVAPREPVAPGTKSR
jgi:stearoyl-CoA desaturase (delta-9 desaturase)